MTVKDRARAHAVSVLRRLVAATGNTIVPRRLSGLDDPQVGPVTPPEVDREAATALRADNPELVDLRRRYESLPSAVRVPSVWSRDYVGASVDLAAFRAHSAYVWAFDELPRATQLKYFVFGQHGQRTAPALLDRLTEDAAFGCLAYDFETLGRVSRDRLDSALELDFLDRHLGLLSRPGLRVLDIGAGYGRLAQRTAEAADDLAAYVCLDAVAESTFLADHYLRHRGLDGRCRSVPLDDWLATTDRPTFDLAVNVHSFSECPQRAVAWWIAQLVELDGPALFLVPNERTGFTSTEADGSSRDCLPLLAEAGYSLVVEEPMFTNPDVAQLLQRSDRLCLFQRS